RYGQHRYCHLHRTKLEYGVGLHYQANQITKDAPQLDIYLTTEQTKKILQAEVYEQMF
ncbi:hypothetical protein OPU39_13645, partial [Acinetobacter nosocomialis]|nr:hypothetical protein [Acinetobacter nosocomialis]